MCEAGISPPEVPLLPGFCPDLIVALIPAIGKRLTRQFFPTLPPISVDNPSDRGGNGGNMILLALKQIRLMKEPKSVIGYCQRLCSALRKQDGNVLVVPASRVK